MRSFQQRIYKARGSALLLVLWSVVILSSTVLVVARLVDFDIDTESRLEKRFIARQMALTGLALAMHPDVKRGDPLLFQKVDEVRRFEVEVESEDARLNINKSIAQPKALVDLFRFWGAKDDEASQAVDSLKDWTDPDEFRSLNGAEARDIMAESGYSVPENRAFYSIQEVESVRGMDRISAIHPGWEDSFSMHSSNKLDLQSVKEDLLQVFGGLSRDQARAFVVYRNGPDGKPATLDDVEIKSVAAVAGVVGLSEMQMKMLAQYFSTGGGLFRITSHGYCGEVQYSVTVVKNKGAGKSAQDDALEWAER